jgi:hypothetical protein
MRFPLFFRYTASAQYLTKLSEERLHVFPIKTAEEKEKFASEYHTWVVRVAESSRGKNRSDIIFFPICERHTFQTLLLLPVFLILVLLHPHHVLLHPSRIPGTRTARWLFIMLVHCSTIPDTPVPVSVLIPRKRESAAIRCVKVVAITPFPSNLKSTMDRNHVICLQHISAQIFVFARTTTSFSARHLMPPISIHVYA